MSLLNPNKKVFGALTEGTYTVKLKDYKEVPAKDTKKEYVSFNFTTETERPITHNCFSEIQVDIMFNQIKEQLAPKSIMTQSEILTALETKSVELYVIKVQKDDKVYTNTTFRQPVQEQQSSSDDDEI
jgi:hypothetical protein